MTKISVMWPGSESAWQRGRWQGLRSGAGGFTLIEVMVAVTIVGILAALAYPVYTQQVLRGKRADAQTGLLQAAQYLQRYYTAQDSFVGAETALDQSGLAAVTSSGRETYAIAAVITNAGRSFTLTATPVGFADAACGKFTLTDTGQKGVSAGTVADCWR